jgi:hypothetical protein
MIQIALIVLFGVTLLYVAARQFVESGRKLDRLPTIDDLSQARAVVDAVFRRTSLVRQIFAPVDLKYAIERCSDKIAPALLAERKEMALKWLRKTQKELAHLFELHLKLASYTYAPSQTTEIRLMIQYASFVVLSNAALVYIWWRGPFAFGAVGEYLLQGSERFFTIFSFRFEQVDPVRLGAAQRLLST